MNSRMIRKDESKLFVLVSSIMVVIFVIFAVIFFKKDEKKIEKPVVKPGTNPVLIKLDAESMPKFSDDLALKDLENVINQSLKYLKKIPGNRMFTFGDDKYPATHMILSLKRFLEFIKKKPSMKEIDQFIRANYIVYKSKGRDEKGTVLFTGYFEPLLSGSLKKSEKYRFPIYGRPDDLTILDLSLFSKKYKGKKITGRVKGKTFVPYHDRKEIDQDRVLDKKADILAWVDDPIDIFFLHIQGSGKIALDSGKTINIQYNSQNGRPYMSIGKLLIDTKKIGRAEMSMQKIREYLNAHPDQMQKVFNYNPSYIFFCIKNDGPYGAINVRLTQERSIALDRKIFPSAALSFIRAEKPVIDKNGNIIEWKKFSRFVSSQDTGGAIKGPGRVDLFWGAGNYARIAAGHMKHYGSLYFFILKQDKAGN